MLPGEVTWSLHRAAPCPHGGDLLPLSLSSQAREALCSPNPQRYIPDNAIAHCSAGCCNTRQSEKARTAPCLSPHSPPPTPVGQVTTAMMGTHTTPCITCCSGKIHPHCPLKLPQLQGLAAPKALTLQHECRCFQHFVKSELGSTD